MNEDNQQNQNFSPPVVGQDVVASPPVPQTANPAPTPTPAPAPVHHQPPAVNSQKARSNSKSPVLAIILATLIFLALSALAYLYYRGYRG